MSKRLLLLVMVTLLSMFVVVGCGSDGSDGKDVDPGTVTALEQQIADLEALIAQLEASDDASSAEIQALLEQLEALQEQLAEYEAGNSPITATASETCATCHGTGKTDDVANKHITDVAARNAKVSAISVSDDGTDVTLNYTLTLEDGTPITDATTASGYYYYNNSTNGLTRVSKSPSTVTHNGGGAYTAVYTALQTELNALDGGVADYRLMVIARNAATPVQYSVVVTNVGTSVRDLVSANACTNCHGDVVFWGNPSGHSYGHAQANVEGCNVCHTRFDRSAGLYAGGTQIANINTPYQPNGTGNLTNYVHGIHNSHNMPAAGTVDAGIYERNASTSKFSIGYPNAMANCVDCHDAPTRLAAVLDDSNFKFTTCMSCHKSWDGFAFEGSAAPFKDYHTTNFPGSATANAVLAYNCVTCHDGSAAPTFAEFHTGYEKERYNGKDIAYEIIGVTYDSATGAGEVEWRAYNTDTLANYDVLNDNVSDGPVFRGDNNTAYRGGNSYAASIVFGFSPAGDDWTNKGASNASGQPSLSVTIGSANTTVDGSDVATTTFTVPEAARTNVKAIAGLQGIPVVGDDYEFAIVSSVTKEFSLSADPLVARRSIVDNAKCQSCHGAFVFHGHNRINSVELCVICHNPNATEKNARVQIAAANEGINTELDGKTEESYDLKVMIHRIHSVSNEEKNGHTAYALLRTRGIYAFFSGLVGYEDWGTPETLASGKGGSWNAVEVHYPQEISNCEACHNPGTYALADQAKAMPLTIQQGTEYASSNGAAVGGYSDVNDVVIGPNQAACTSCHLKSDAVGHTTSLGYKGKGDKTAIITDKQ